MLNVPQLPRGCASRPDACSRRSRSLISALLTGEEREGRGVFSVSREGVWGGQIPSKEVASVKEIIIINAAEEVMSFLI